MKYQIDSPSESDLFDSQGHSNAAWAMQDTLENHEDIHIIGLEGDLGAGKSTVLKLLENGMENSRKKHHFFIFDVEQYHHSSTKASLIQFFSNKLKSTFKGNEEKVEEAKDKALGNILTYTKKVDSTLSLWTVAFAVLLYMFTRSAQDLFEQLNSLLNKLYFLFENPELTSKVPSELALDLYPFLVFISILFYFVFCGLSL